jgi:hypothetical protein
VSLLGVARRYERTFGEMDRRVSGLELALREFATVKDQASQYANELQTTQSRLQQVRRWDVMVGV